MSNKREEAIDLLMGSDYSLEEATKTVDRWSSRKGGIPMSILIKVGGIPTKIVPLRAILDRDEQWITLIDRFGPIDTVTQRRRLP